jgi:hypothetical protein
MNLVIKGNQSISCKQEVCTRYQCCQYYGLLKKLQKLLSSYGFAAANFFKTPCLFSIHIAFMYRLFEKA